MLSGALQVKLLEALLSAFPNPSDLDIAAKAANLSQCVSDFLVARGTTYRQGLFEYLGWVEAQNLLVGFLKAARQENPGSQDLGEVINKLADLGSAFAELRALGNSAPPSGPERLQGGKTGGDDPLQVLEKSLSALPTSELNRLVTFGLGESPEDIAAAARASFSPAVLIRWAQERRRIDDLQAVLARWRRNPA
jgi:hypothetical protein